MGEKKGQHNKLYRKNVDEWQIDTKKEQADNETKATKIANLTRIQTHLRETWTDRDRERERQSNSFGVGAHDFNVLFRAEKNQIEYSLSAHISCM